MEDTKERIHHISHIEKRLICAAKEKIDEGIECIDTKEMGMVIDMIKDLTESEKNLVEAMQAESIVKAMHDSEDDPWAGREAAMYYKTDYLGYNRNRYASGRYAPKGHGHVSMGYEPMKAHHDDHMAEMMVDDYDPKYGESYNHYRMAKRHYHETKSEEDKATMEEHAKHHMHETMETMKEIYRTSPDPDLKKSLKDGLIKLVNEM